MLVYDPAFDAYHCIFRLLTLLEREKEIEIDTLRILDFALCFPSVVSTFKLPKEFSAARAAARQSFSPYREALGPSNLFLSLQQTQEGALACLVASGYISGESMYRGTAARTAISLPPELHERCALLIKREEAFFRFLKPTLLEIPLNGPQGLKARSCLMEYRYDYI